MSEGEIKLLRQEAEKQSGLSWMAVEFLIIAKTSPKNLDKEDEEAAVAE